MSRITVLISFRRTASQFLALVVACANDVFFQVFLTTIDTYDMNGYVTYWQYANGCSSLYLTVLVQVDVVVTDITCGGGRTSGKPLTHEMGTGRLNFC